MTTAEALALLDLRPTATPSEIKQAYRDAARAWHPDKHGDNPSRRARAEERLKRVNEAYEVLKDYDPPPRIADRTRTPSARSSPVASRSAAEPSPPAPQATPRNARMALVALATLAIVAIVVFAIPRGTAKRAEPSAAAPTTRPAPPPAAAVDARAGGTIDRGSLDPEEEQSLELACLFAKLEGPARYDACLRDQLAMLARAERLPSLTALGPEERQSIEIACVSAKAEGPAKYNACLAKQLAMLAKGRRRPDLSSLSEGELQSIELVCGVARARGPAEYNQCLVDQLAALRR